MDKVTLLKHLKENIGPRPTMPEEWEESEELTWRHGACFMWDKVMKLICDLES